MADPRIASKHLYIFDLANPQGIQMNVPHQLQKIRILLTKNRFVPILEQMTVSLVSPVKIHHITRQQPPHALRNGLIAGPQ
jgi:hypothetical protein